MKSYLIILILIIVANLSNAQTSMDEYLYITEGYYQQKIHDLSDKKGYKLEDLGNYGLKFSDYELNFVFKGLKSTENQKLVGLLIEYEKKSKSGKSVYDYYCIPHPKSSDEIWNKALAKINGTNDKEILKAYNWALTKYISQLRY